MKLVKWLGFFLAVIMLAAACGSPSAPSSAAPSPITPVVDMKDALLTWQNSGMPCEQAVFTLANLSFGPCAGALTELPAERTGHAERLFELTNTYASFTAQTAAGSVSLHGNGRLIAALAEQRAIAEWARLMFQVAQAGRSGASWGLALAWHREGGFAGFCDDVGVYLTGLVIASDCKGFNEQFYLTASQLEQVYGWVDGLKNIDYSYKDPAVVDAMSMTLVLSGAGQEEPSEEDIRSILDFAASLKAQANFASNVDANATEAERTLREYFAAMNSGDYALAAVLYAGPTDMLEDWNPDITNDLAALFERGCKQNGLKCLLPRSVIYGGLDAESNYRFLVEFNNADGSLFIQGPCCGGTEGSSVSVFLYRVAKRESGYVVMDLPPYIP
ncbi:MAG: hypothetical protein A2Z03_05865 [Chloroflexi bacterium RBG_16_56_8]|nr:MAG: hypothetical protein A2Z03_05865 [Chloroflexi bacterium RBG_16_56_8]